MPNYVTNEITTSLAKQLDRVKLSGLEVWGRVRLGNELHAEAAAAPLPTLGGLR